MNHPPLACFYHTRLSGGLSQDNLTVPKDFAGYLYTEQMRILESSGLGREAEVHIGLNGDGDDAAFARMEAPNQYSVTAHGANAKGLLPTMRLLQNWLPSHPEHLVCFFHMKGVTHPHDVFNAAWRNCMTRHVIWNWRKCVEDLQAGYESVGAHWLMTPFGQGHQDEGGRFWGGVFFWATAKFLLTLPPLPTEITDRHSWYAPEHWIGKGPQLPKVKDYAPHWPNTAQCSESSKA